MKTALRVQIPPSGTQMTTLGSISSGIPSRFHLDNYGNVSAEVYELPDDPDGQVAVTVSLMNRYAVDDSHTVKVLDALTLACRLGRQVGLVCTRLDDLIAAIHLYVRRSCRFVPTIEAATISQYDMQLRIFQSLPLIEPQYHHATVMWNLIGAEGYAGRVKYENLNKAMAIEGVHLHLYGKENTKPGRKMGHITILDNDVEVLKKKLAAVENHVRVVS